MSVVFNSTCTNGFPISPFLRLTRHRACDTRPITRTKKAVYTPSRTSGGSVGEPVSKSAVGRHQARPECKRQVECERDQHQQVKVTGRDRFVADFPLAI